MLTTESTPSQSTSATTNYRDAAPIYRARGWTGVLPKRPGSKAAGLPKGRTGRAGIDPDDAQVERWREQRGDDDLILRVPTGVIGIDVDHYLSASGTQKRGGDTIAEAERRWGPLPATVRSTARADGVSGIRFYRVPEGTETPGVLKLTTDDEGVFGDVEFIQRHHRYAVVWPSTHDALDQQYRWLDATGEPTDVPAPDELPALPERWVEELSVRPAADGATGGSRARREHRSAADTDAALAAMLTPGDMSAEVAQRLDEALTDLHSGGSRFDTSRDHTLALLRLGDDGESGVYSAVEQLRAAYIEAVDGDRDGGAATAEAEFDRYLGGAANLIADNAPVTLAGVLPGQDAPDRKGAVLNLPVEFWDAHPQLARIRAAAHARVDCADVVLGTMLALIAANLDPSIRVVTGAKSPLPLNLYVGIVATSGTGKTSGYAAAGELLDLTHPDPFDAALTAGAEIPEAQPIGSGQGIVEAYMGQVPDPTDAKGKRMIRRQVRHKLLLHSDEAASVVSEILDHRSKVGPTLRAGWSGELLGDTNATAERKRRVADYSLGVVIGCQRDALARLLTVEGLETGSAQRFITVVGTDPSIPDDADPIDGKIAVTLPTTGLHYCPQLQAQTRRELLARARGEAKVDPLESQRPAQAARVAALFAILFGDGPEVTVEHRRLADMLIDSSLAAQRDAKRWADEQAAAKMEQRTRAAVDTAVATAAAVSDADAALDRLGERITRYLVTNGGAMTLAGRDGLWHKFRSAERTTARAALTRLESRGAVSVDDDKASLA